MKKHTTFRKRKIPKKIKYGKGPEFFKRFSELANFLALFQGFDLTIEETELLIFKFFNGETYERVAQLVSRVDQEGKLINNQYTKQNAEEKLKYLFKRMNKQIGLDSKLQELKLLIPDESCRTWGSKRDLKMLKGRKHENG